jgi:hypothetical protein
MVWAQFLAGVLVLIYLPTSWALARSGPHICPHTIFGKTKIEERRKHIKY